MELLLQPLQQRQDLRLDGDVEGGGRLVGDQQLRPADQRHRDHDPLPHAARELVRVGVHALLGIRHAHGTQHLHRRGGRLVGAHAGVLLQGLPDLKADGVDRGQRPHRLLEDHGHVTAADGTDAPAPLRQLGQVDRVPLCRKHHGAAFQLSGRALDQPQHAQRGDALAAAALAHHPQRLVGRYAEADAVHRPHDAVVRVEVRPEVAHPEQRIAHVAALTWQTDRRHRGRRRREN